MDKYNICFHALYLSSVLLYFLRTSGKPHGSGPRMTEGESVCDVLLTDPTGPQLRTDPRVSRKVSEVGCRASHHAEKDDPPGSTVTSMEKCVFCRRQMWAKFTIEDHIYLCYVSKMNSIRLGFLPGEWVTSSKRIVHPKITI